MKKNFKIILLLLLILLTASLIFAEEDKKEETKKEEKFKPEFGFTFINLFNYNSNHPYFVESILYENEIGVSMTIPVKFYSLTLWADNIFDFNWEEGSSYVYEALFDELSFGLENKFTIEKVMDITVIYEHYINFSPVDGVRFKYAPIINLSGEYDFGLYWEIETGFYMGYNPTAAEKKAAFTGFYNESYLELSFEFFHFFAPEDYTMSLYLEDTFTFDIPYAYDTVEIDKLISNEIKAGLNIGIFGFAPYFNAYLFPQNYINNSLEPSDSVFDAGINAGFEVNKDWFTFILDYVGAVNVLNVDAKWINTIEASVEIEF